MGMGQVPEDVLAERYAAHVLDNYFDGRAGAIRTTLVQDLYERFYNAYGESPSEQDFSQLLAEEYGDTVKEMEYAVESTFDTLLEDSRKKGPVCDECLGNTSYTDWVGNGAPTWDEGRPLLSTEVTVHDGIPTTFHGLDSDDAEGDSNLIVVSYSCPQDQHDTGFEEYHAVTNEETARIQSVLDSLEEL